MLSKKFRLKGKKNFDEVFKQGEKKNSPYFTLHYLTKSDTTNPRFGIVISKKIGNAVTRNKIRRQIYHILQDFLNTKNIDYVIVCSKPITTLDYTDIKNTLSAIITSIQ